MANEKEAAGVALTVEQLIQTNYDYPLANSALEANHAANRLNDSIELRAEIKSQYADPALATLNNQNVPSTQRQEAGRAFIEYSLGIASMAGKEVGLSRTLEQELNEVLVSLPEGQRAAYTAGFLYHHDLIKVVDSKSQDPKGNYVYESNPDMNQPHPGNFIPTAAINKDRTPQ